MPSEDTSIHSLPSILVSYQALSRLANSFCSISVFSFLGLIKQADRFLLSICLCIGYLLFGSSSLSTKGKRWFYICVSAQRKIAVWAAKKPDRFGLFAGDIHFVSTLWSECNYRISENADISMVCWQSARGIYSKVILSEGMPVDSSLSLYSIFNSLRREL